LQTITVTTTSMEQSLSWEINSIFKYCKNIQPYAEPEGLLPCSRYSVTCHYREQYESNLQPYAVIRIWGFHSGDYEEFCLLEYNDA
jgi:hypothetical protein